MFQNNGMAGLRHGITQITTRSGDVLYDWEKDAHKPTARADAARP